MTLSTTTPIKVALIAVRQQHTSFEMFDGNGQSLGVANTPAELWSLLQHTMAQVSQETELPTPEQVTLENIVRSAGATIGNFIEERHPGALKLTQMFLRGATMAKQNGYFED